MTLAYDPADRLTHAMVSSGSTLLRDTQYGLDRMGNRTNVSGAATCSGDYFMDGTVPGPMDFQMNQYTSTACDTRSYDANGNLVSRGSAAGPVTFQYDYANRLVLVQAWDFNTSTLVLVASYTYDALGRRIAKTVFGGGGLPPVTTQFVFDGDSVIEERVSGAVSASFVLDGTRSHDDGVIQMQRNGKPYYYHTDDQGNVLALTTTGGAVAERYDYDDFGAVTFLTTDGVPTTATSSSVGNVYCWGGLRLDSETGLHCDDGAGYLETASGRCLAHAQDDLQRTGSIVQLLTRNNPWSGSGPVAMKTGTVKFFNETKGFGRMKASRNMTLKGQKILQNRMAGGGYWGGTPDPGSANVVVGNFVGTVASSNSAVTAR
jgi:YD repeat-containing protein